MSWLKTHQYFAKKIVQVAFHSQLPNFYFILPSFGGLMATNTKALQCFSIKNILDSILDFVHFI